MQFIEKQIELKEMYIFILKFYKVFSQHLPTVIYDFSDLISMYLMTYPETKKCLYVSIKTTDIQTQLYLQ